MSAFALMTPASATGQTLRQQSSRPTGLATPSAFWKVARPPVRGRAPVARFARSGPQAYGWCGPGVMGGPNVLNRPLSEILQQLERDFGTSPHQRRHEGDNSAGRPGAMRLPVDSIETDEAIWYFTDLPGLEKSDLQIQVNNQERTITISGERSPPTVGDDDEAKLKRNLQRRFGKFSHAIQLPKEANAQLISAKVDKGVLRIKVLKEAEPEPELQTVQID